MNTHQKSYAKLEVRPIDRMLRQKWLAAFGILLSAYDVTMFLISDGLFRTLWGGLSVATILVVQGTLFDAYFGEFERKTGDDR